MTSTIRPAPILASFLTLVAGHLWAFPAAAAPQLSADEAAMPWSASAALGPSFENATALRLRVEGAMSLLSLTESITLDVALPMSVAFWGQSSDISLYAVGYSIDYSYVRFELVPTARLKVSLTKEFGLYGDAGLGFDYYSVSYRTNAPLAYMRQESSGAGGLFRLSGGGWWAFDERFRLFVEPVGFGIYLGSGSSPAAVYSMMVGASYRF